MAALPYDITVARARIERVFRYLQELHRVRTPPVLDIDRYEWILRLDTLPRHAAIQRGFVPGSDGDESGPAPDRGFILAVDRPATETECPPPSVLFENWLEPGWEQPGAAAAVFAIKHHPATNREEDFEDKEERVLAYEAWLEKRWKWEDSESLVVAAARLFSDLFTQWGKFERESEKLQLFLGDGILVATHAGETVRHPLLLQRVQLEFDANKPRFTVMATGDPADLYTPLLRYLEVDPKRLLQFKERLAADELHPLGGQRTSEFLKDLVQTCWKDGVYFDSAQEAGRGKSPYVYRQPALYLGNRNQGFTNTIERYIDVLPNATELPESLLRIVGIETGRGSGAHEPAVTDILLTRDANREQKRVIGRLDETGAVLVQGPPGTGKSHTIANLIGHLLAQGKTILVTSHASKALRIVREKVAERLQSLCVSLLDSDEESTRQLEESITGILNYLSSTTRAKLDKDIARITEAREALRAERDALTVKLQDAVKEEHEELVILGERMTPSEAAKRASKSAGRYDWLPGPVRDDLGLTIDELGELYRLNKSVSASDEELLGAERPAVKDLPAPAEVAALLDDLKRGESARPNPTATLWLDDKQTRESLAELDALVRDTIATLSDDSPWMIDCLAAGRDGGPEKKAWEGLVEEVRRVAREVPLRDELILEHGAVVESTRPRAELLETCKEILVHLDEGKKLGRVSLMFNSTWNELIDASKVNGAAPATPAHFRAILCGARGRPAAREPRAALGSPARGTRRAHERDAGPPNREEGPRDHREDRVGAELARRDVVAVPRGVREERFRLAAAARAGAARRRSGPDPHGARQARADLRRPRAEYARARSRGAARGLDRQPQGRLEPERRVSAGQAAAQRDPQRRLRRLRRRAYEAARGRRSHRRCRAAARAAGAPRADGAGLGCGDR